MRLQYTLINLGITAGLIILSSLLGGNLTNPLHFYWIAVLIFLSVIIQILIIAIKDKGAELKAEKDKVSAFLLTKNSNQTSLQCAIFPKANGARIVKNNLIPLELYINSYVDLRKSLDIKLSSNKKCIVKVNHQSIISKQYAGNYEFYLDNSNVYKLENRYYKYSFDISFEEIGNYILKVEANNGETIIEVSNSLMVHNN